MLPSRLPSMGAAPCWATCPGLVPWDGSLLPLGLTLAREGGQDPEVGAEPISVPQTSPPQLWGAAGVVTLLLPPKGIPRATGVRWGRSTSGGLTTQAPLSPLSPSV